jgi:hypothetical protein
MTRPSSVLAVRSGDRLIEVQIAAGGFLAGYSDNTLLAYRQDLMTFFDWCRRCGVGVLDVRRSHLELFARSLEVGGYARATTARRLSTLSSFYRYCAEEEFVATNPAANIRRPKRRQESTMQGLDRNELGAFLVQAGLSNERDHALACLLALNGLRVSEALGCDVTDLGFDRGLTHSTCFARAARKSLHRSHHEPHARCISLRVNDRRDRYSPSMAGPGWTGTKQRGSLHAWHGERASTNAYPHTRCVTDSSPQHSTQESRYVTFRRPRRTPIHGQQCGTTGQEDHSTATPPTSLPRSSREPADNAPYVPICVIGADD